MENKAQKVTLISGIFASVAAVSCCIGPVLFAVLGVSSAGVLSKMEPYRPYLTVITVILLGSAFYFTYRKKNIEACDSNSYCANPRADKWNRVILWSATVLILGFLTFPYWSIHLI